ncbi:MAG TPA: trypsin-like serine protease [Pseudonocardiaceae bacterium]|nr:trypsin-like serine protease [Pseudonocardiaceae bacterium]
MNKFVSAALIGGTAIAVGVLPAASMASAATPPAPNPNPAPTAPAAPGGTHHAPGHHAPTHHRKPGSGHTSGSHKPTGGHRTAKHKPGKRKPGRHHAGKPGAGQPGTGKSGPGTGKSGPGAPVVAPVAHKPVRHRPIQHRPVIGKPVGKPVTGKPVITPVAGKPMPRIIGGQNATDAPWAAQVYWDDMGFECSGSVIAPQWVLTAGHCVNDGGMSVEVDSLKLGGGTEIEVDSTQVDPNGDMALLHLAQPVKTTFAKLADADPQVGAENQIYGWGKTSPNGGPAKRLRVANVKVTDLNCVDGKQGKAICSAAEDGSAFNGDSGGPEMSDGVEVGVCSTGDDQAKTQQYASVAANRTWLRQVASV